MMKRFQFPLSISVVHYAVVFILTAITRRIWEFYSSEKRVILEWSVYIKRVGPTAVATALDIGFSNWSLMFITISLYTMCKSTAIIFILGFALILGLEKFHYLLFVIVLLIVGGLIMFTYESTEFNLTGFILVMSASAVSGVRWATAQILLQKKSWGLSSPFDTIYHLQPLMTLAVLPLALSIEGPKLAVSVQTFRAPSSHVVAVTVSLVLFGAFLAFMLTVSEYLLLSHTSSVTLAVSGIFKEICTIFIATEFGEDEMDWLKFGGFVICLSGIILHVIFKTLKDEKGKNRTKSLVKDEEQIMLSSNHQNCESDDEYVN